MSSAAASRPAPLWRCPWGCSPHTGAGRDTPPPPSATSPSPSWRPAMPCGGKLSVVIFYLAVPPLAPTTGAIANGSSAWADSPGQASRLYALGPNWGQEHIVWAPTRSALTRTADPFDLCFIQHIIHIPRLVKNVSLFNIIFPFNTRVRCGVGPFYVVGSDFLI